MKKLTVVMLLSVAAPSALLAEDAAPVPAQPADERALPPIPPEALQKLSPADIKELLQQREKTLLRLEGIRNHEDEDDSKVAILVPGFFFLAIIAAIVTTLLYRARKDRLLHQTLGAMIEKGVNIPPELLTPPQQKANDLRRGFVLVLGGFAGCLFGLFTQGFAAGTWSAGLIPMLIGVGYVLAWAVEKRQAAVSRGAEG
ncbi:MAG: hypothetical protein HY904_24980 [Deltaproteobacteria bacterium]|nr:hypothetical protein [Deltaproteobacteria bacterium]